MMCAIHRDTVETTSSNGAKIHEFLTTAKAKLWLIMASDFSKSTLLVQGPVHFS